MDIGFSSAASLARALRGGRIGSLELLEHFIARNRAQRGAVNALAATRLEHARVRARAADRARGSARARGPLFGLPVTVKESFDVAGMRTTFGLARYRANRPRASAVAVQRLEAAGAIVFGKTNIPVLLADWQSYNPLYGITRNPWNRSRSPGGSSGGAAAALASGLTALELGSDIGGSIRNPAHCCGVYGHKPSFGIVPTRGHGLPGSFAELDIQVAGPLARSAFDLEIALRVLAGPDAARGRVWALELPAARQRTLGEFRVAVLVSARPAPVDVEIRGAIEELARFLEACKVRVSRSARPRLPLGEVSSLFVRLLRAATSAVHNDNAAFRQAQADVATLEPADRSYHAEQLRGNTLAHRDWIVADNRRHALMPAWEDFFRDYDLLLCPAAPTTAFPHDHEGLRSDRLVTVNGRRRPVNEHLFWAGYSGMFYLPSTVAPIGLSRGGLPIGVQIIGPPGGDLSCIRFAQLLEKSYHRFIPPPAFANPSVHSPEES